MTPFIPALNVLSEMKNCRSEYVLVESGPSRAGSGLEGAVIWCMSRNNSSVSCAQGDLYLLCKHIGNKLWLLGKHSPGCAPPILRLHISRRYKAQILQLYKKKNTRGSSLHKFAGKSLWTQRSLTPICQAAEILTYTPHSLHLGAIGILKLRLSNKKVQ